MRNSTRSHRKNSVWPITITICGVIQRSAEGIERQNKWNLIAEPFILSIITKRYYLNAKDGFLLENIDAVGKKMI
jgi:hypothetical protein